MNPPFAPRAPAGSELNMIPPIRRHPRPVSPHRRIGLLIAATSLALTSCDRKQEAAAPPPQRPANVWLATVEVREFSDEVEALGTVRAYEAIDLSPNVTETVTELHFKDGQMVKKDALLAELSSAEEAAILEGAKVNLAEQEREVERLRELADEGAVSQARLQGYLTARDLALQKIEEANARLADRQITAPFAGVLGFRRISKGALVAPGDVIGTLDFIDTVKLDFAVPETFLGDLTPGMVIAARSGAFPDDSFTGTVTDIDSRVNPITRSVIVRAEIPNSDHKLRSGMLLTTRVKKNPSESPAIPERALLSVQENHFVFTVDRAEGTAKVTRVPVSIGRRQPGYVEITEGVASGTRIVADGIIGLRDGAEVTIIGEAAPPSASYSPTAEPESETPHSDTVDAKVDADKVDADAPDAKAPDADPADAPDSDAPDADAPDGESPNADKVDAADAPDTDAPDADAAESE